MSTRKYVRDLNRAIKPLGWRVRRKYSGGTHLIVTNGKHSMSASLSPKNTEHSIKATVRNIKRYYPEKRT